MREVVEQAAAVAQAKAEEKALQLVVQVHPTVPRQCLSDPGRLKRVLLHLLSNGTACVCVCVCPDQESSAVQNTYAAGRK